MAVRSFGVGVPEGFRVVRSGISHEGEVKVQPHPQGERGDSCGPRRPGERSERTRRAGMAMLAWVGPVHLGRVVADVSVMDSSGDRQDVAEGDGLFRPSFDVVLVSAQGGDGRAFEQLFEVLSRRVYAFVRVRGATDPEGMVNDVFLKVFTGLGGFAGNEVQFRAWVFTIARNTLIDEGRRRQRRVAETSMEASDEAGAAVGDVEAEALGSLGNTWVAAELGVLTAEQREVVVLRIVADLTIEAIAEVLGKRVGAVKALQRRAFRTLAKNLEREAAPL